MMKRENLFKFFSGETSYEEEVDIRRWIEESEENKKQAIKERHIFDSILLLTGGEKKKSWHGRKIFSIGKDWIKVAAAVVITLGISFTVQHIFDREAAAPMLSFHVPKGQRINMTLPDGTNVWLNSNTTINYPSYFDGETRTVSVSGEAFFEVVRDKNHPFIVNTDKCTTKVLGTKFNLSSYGEDDFAEVALMEGKVEVMPQGIDDAVMVLTPGAKAVVSDDGKMVRSAITDYDVYRWKEGLICFNNETFDEIMNKLGMLFDTEIKINNRNVMKYEYTGKFRYTDGLDYALRVMKKAIGFDYSYDENMDVIYIK